ncbi:MAG: PP2C family protein-serine/threonine phosphatase [Planctomycetota bacterium]|jgi:sigma-B regulation protein RsbU (phosphoserine phosphatase)
MPTFGKSRHPLRKISDGGKGKSSSGGLKPVQASITLLRKEAQRKLALRQRLGLLKHKTYADDLDEVEKRMLDHELAIAEELQANLLPRRIPQIPGYDMSAYYRPSREVGGDYYDFIDIDADHIGMIVADVSGKGIPGSIVMTETRALMRSEGSRTMSPAEALIRVNRHLHRDIKRGMFVTAFYLVLSVQKGIITVTSAGHNPMVLWRSASDACLLVNPNGLALGIDRGPLFEKTIQEQRIHLGQGDRFVLYTDGVVETMNEQKEVVGQEWFYMFSKKMAQTPSDEFIGAMVNELKKYQARAPQHDDITVVTARTVGELEGVKEPILDE